MKKAKYMRAFACIVIALSMLFAMFMFSGCSRRTPPELDEVYDRFVYLLETAPEVNTVLIGEGLPTFDREGDEARLLRLYYMASEDGREYVKPYTMFRSVDEIKTAAAALYSIEYLDSIYESLFTGYTAEELGGSVLPARYTEDEKSLYENKNVTPLINGTRVYDYASMEIDKTRSSAEYVKVKIDSYGDDGERDNITVSFVLEDGKWYLDSQSA